MKKKKRERIIYYDSACGLCHNLVRIIINFDRTACFYFSPIQSLHVNIIEKFPDSIILMDGGKYFAEGRALIKILKLLDKPWCVFGYILNFFPMSIINFTYRLISRNRGNWFTKPKDKCPLVAKEKRERFIFK